MHSGIFCCQKHFRPATRKTFIEMQGSGPVSARMKQRIGENFYLTGFQKTFRNPGRMICIKELTCFSLVPLPENIIFGSVGAVVRCHKVRCKFFEKCRIPHMTCRQYDKSQGLFDAIVRRMVFDPVLKFLPGGSRGFFCDTMK